MGESLAELLRFVMASAMMLIYQLVLAIHLKTSMSQKVRFIPVVEC